MQTIIWAFGSMVVLLIVLAFVPLGFTFKGKLSIVLACFVISLGGLAAINTFSLPLTGLLLIVLSFFTAYILDQRAGRLIYATNRSIEEEYEEINSNHSITDYKLESDQEIIPLNLTELGKAAPKIQSVVVETRDELTLTSLNSIEGLEDEGETQLIEEDISFFHEEDIEQQPILQDVEIGPEENLYSEIEEDLSIDELVIDSLNSDEGYLSEIESLLNVGIEEINSGEKKDFAEDFSTKDVTEEHFVETEDLEPLDDLTLEVLLGSKEVASGLDDEIKDMKNKDIIKK
ncbi:phage holin family protein [Neobacillus cucumis]|uniref:phage holin family protein n=1 Tax=Neobacillus cucumis TaxID=1740721 RepID=UPI0018E051CA|nr:phage holin family protein [Neobacillus cucumis]MBI0576517.1 phage holin family protein [Neobacillus cucumis]